MQNLKSSFAAIIILALSMSFATTANAQFAKALLKHAAKEAAKEAGKEIAKEVGKQIVKDLVLNEMEGSANTSTATTTMTTTEYTVSSNQSAQAEISFTTTQSKKMFLMVIDSAL